MKYLTAEDLLRIHHLIVEETGGSHGVRDHHVLASLEGSPRQTVFGRELYASAFEKAAVYAHRIIRTHPFIDGNKRTGMTAAIVFLEDNGYRFSGPKRSVEAFALEIIHEQYDIPEIADWLKTHTKPLRRRKRIG